MPEAVVLVVAVAISWLLADPGRVIGIASIIVVPIFQHLTERARA